MSAITVNDQPSSSLESASVQPQSPAQGQVVAKGKLWTGRVLSILAVLFLLFDAVGKLIMPAPVVQAFLRLGFPTTLAVSVGLLLMVCTVLYAIPRTSVLGAVLLTGFFGGAIAIQMRAGSTLFETVFPAIFGVLMWAGLLLREPRLLQLFPFRRNSPS